MATYVATTGRDFFETLNDVDDTFVFTRETMTHGDLVLAFAIPPSPTGSPPSETLILGAGRYAATGELDRILGIDHIVFGPGGVDVTLSPNFASYSRFGGSVAVADGAGDDRVNASRFAAMQELLFTSAAGGADTVIGGTGGDVFTFDAALLTAADILSGGAGRDLLVITGDGPLAADALTQVTGIEVITVTGAPQAVYLTDAQFSAHVYAITVSGAALLDASALTGLHHVIVEALPGSTLLGGDFQDIFRLSGAALAGGVTIDGGDPAGVYATDTIVIIEPGSVAAEAFGDLTSVERIELAVPGIALALADSAFAGLPGGTLSVLGSAGDDVVDASGLTGARRIDVTPGMGEDRILGGAGDDLFRITTESLTAADSISGGAGRDTLQVVGPGTLDAAALAGVTGVERLALSDYGNAVVLSEAFVLAAGGLIVVACAESGADTIDGSALVTGRMDVSGRNSPDVLVAGGGRDRLRGGEGGEGAWGDLFVFRDASASSPGAPDSIMDFSAAEADRIDLSGLAPGALEFIGASPFSAADQLRVVPRGTAQVVQVSLDADRAAEFVLYVHADAPLTAADFIL
jgi:hypothetical protein